MASKRDRTRAERQARLLEIMDREGITSKALADMLSVHHMTIYKWREGIHEIPEHTLRYIEFLI